MSSNGWRRFIPSDLGTAFSNLYTVMFGFTFSFMLATALNFLWGGIDIAWSAPIGEVLARVAILGMTLGLSGIYFYHTFALVQRFSETDGTIINYYEIVLTCIMSTGSWACYHVARVVVKPFSSNLYPWAHPILNSDVFYLLVFVPGLALLLLLHPIVWRLQKWATLLLRKRREKSHTSAGPVVPE